MTSARLLTSCGEDSAVLLDETPCCGEQLVEILQRVGHLAVGVGERVGELREVVVQRHELLVALVQRVDEQREALDHAEEVPASLVEGEQRLGQPVECLIELLALARESVGGGLDDVAERAPRLLRCRTEIGEQAVQRVTQVVVLDGHLGAVGVDDGVVLQHRAAGVGRRQLNRARRHQARVQDRRGRVGGNLELLVVVERDPHLVAVGLDLVDRPHPDTHDLDLVAGVQRQRLGEIGDHGVGGEPLVDVPPDEGGHDTEDHHDAADDHRGPRYAGHLEVSDVEDRRHLLQPP